MSQRDRLAKQLQRVRKELDEVAGHVDALAKALSEPEPAVLDLVGQAEVATMAGVKSSTVGVWVSRGQLPEPVAKLACGRVWAKGDIEAWLKSR
jgi:predicted DNA-binding transcriptional regulator AlpA